MVHKPQTLKLAEIQERFKQHSAEATLTCAGNRRAEISAIKTVGGVQWDAGAIGNARWTGPTLADLLRSAEIKEGAKHVWFEGADAIPEKDGASAPFGGSIPLDKALGEEADRTKADRTKAEAALPLVAHAMNDQPLTTDHGFPLRTVVPGYIGARSVKWLTKITLSDRPSPNHFLAAAYKLVQSDSPAETAAAEPIYDFPVNAAICTPAAGTELRAGRTLVSGYTLPAGQTGCTVEKVEVSADGGRNWIPAQLLGEGSPFTWRQWAALVDLSAGRHDLVVRATD
jgi:sulfite oxidase